MVDTAQPPDFPRRFWIYHLAVVTAAVIALGLWLRASGISPSWLMLGAGALMVIGELTAITLPRGGYVSLGGVVDLAALLVLGPLPTAFLNVIATVAVQGVVRRRPPVQVVHNMAVFALTVCAAGAAFLAAGGTVGRIALPGDAWPVIACALVYVLVNSTLIATVIALAQRESPARVWEGSFRPGMLHQLAFVAVGVLVALLYQSAGAWGLLLFAVPLVVMRHSFQRYVEIRTDLREFVRALSEVLEEVDPYTRQHSLRVAQYSVRLARELGRPEREIADIEYAALVHDLGKIGPQHQHLLQKPGTLSHEEQRTLRSHPAAGAEIVAKVRALKGAADIVRLHHERPDGRGYPYGLLAADVPLGARILNVTDAFDAMTSDRPYRRARSVPEALRELDRGAGTQFDRDVVECLLRLHGDERFPIIPSPSSEELLSLRLRPRPATR